MWKDLAFTLRTLRRSPLLALVAILSLGVGIGVNTTAFSVADALFLRPLPVDEPNQIVTLKARAEGRRQDNYFSYAECLELASGVPSFAGVAGISRRGSLLKTGDDSELLSNGVVTGNYFDLLGVKARLGRTLHTATDSRLDQMPAAVLTHRLWQRRFGSDPAIVGKAIPLSNGFVTVVGVLPPAFSDLQQPAFIELFLSPSAWFVTTGSRGEFEYRGTRQLELVARLRAGATKEQAQVQVAAVGARLASAWAETNRDRTFQAAMTAEERLQAGLKPLGLLLAIVGLVLWIACGNVAGLLLAQAEGRRREIGIRQALGASRLRLLRQMITESFVLAVAGAAVGLLVAGWLLDVLPSLLPPAQTVMDLGLHLDARVLVFTLAATLLTVLLFGLTPALRASRSDVVPALKGEGMGTGRRRTLLRCSVVAAQVTLAVVLLNTAGLLLASFLHTRSASRGFDTSRNLACVFMVARWSGDGEQSTAAVYERLREEAAALPGVRRATYARRLPMFSSGGGATVMVEFPGLPLPAEEQRAGLHYNQIGPGYLDVIGTRVLRGRAFQAEDSAQGSRVIAVSAALARKYFGETDPLERTLLVSGKPARIVAVLEDAPMDSVHEAPQPYLYVPFAQRPVSEATLIVETTGDSAAMSQQVKKLVHRVAPQSKVLSTLTLRDHMKEVLFTDWIEAVMSGCVAVLGVALAAVGLFAAVSFAASRRAREFGIRLALGARRADVFSLVVRQSLVLAGVGVAAGVLCALAAARLLGGVLYGVEPSSPLTLGASALIALLVAVLASLAPALRAVRVDPSETLRAE